MEFLLIKRIEEIREDGIHGANWLSRKTLGILKYGIGKIEAKDKKEFLERIADLGKKLREAKPTMAPIGNNVSEVIHGLSGESEGERLPALRKRGISLIDELLKRSRLAFRNCITYAGELIAEKDKIMTCSYSSTVCEVFKISRRKKADIRIAESRFKSRNYGEITSRILREEGISHALIPDRDIEGYISRVKKVLVGADSVLRDGSLINGIPTYRMALAAKEKVPFYVICQSNKFNARKRVRLEEGFDLTPPELITEIITEFGRVKPQEVARFLEGECSHE